METAMPHDPEDHTDDGQPPDPSVDQEEAYPDPDSLLDDADREALREQAELRRRAQDDPGSLQWRESGPGER